MKERILILGATILQKPLILKAKEMNLETIVLSQNENEIAVKDSDIYHHANIFNVEEVLKIAQKENEKQNISGVVTVGTDASFTVANIAKALHLPGNEPEVAKRCTNKYLMKKTFQEKKIPTAKFFPVKTLDELEKAFYLLDQKVVLKPILNMGARGVAYFDNLNNLKNFFNKAFSFNKGETCLLLEEYIEGLEFSLDALIDHGEILITGIADRIIEYFPYFVETGHVMPSIQENFIQEEIKKTFILAIKAMGITQGAAKGDIKYSPQKGVQIGEIAARLSGGFMSTHTFPLATAYDLMEQMILLSLGKPLSKKNYTYQNTAIERSIIAFPGKIIEIQKENLDQNEGLKYLFLDAKKGDMVVEPTNNVEKQGHLIVVGKDYKKAFDFANKARNAIHIITQKTVENEYEKKIKTNAKTLFETCKMCKVCNGLLCMNQIPGVGGLDYNFNEQVVAFSKYKFTPCFLTDIKAISQVDTSCTFLGQELSMPVLVSPIAGVHLNMTSKLSEIFYQRSVTKGAFYARTLSMVGDVSMDEGGYPLILEAVLENFSRSIPTFKPRKNIKDILLRIESAKQIGVSAIAMDIDAIFLKTMEINHEPTCAKSLEDLILLKKACGKTPFILKGILSKRDAKVALEAGIDAIIVSSHGGRINSSFISPLEGLKDITKEINGKIPIILDGGIRSGGDVLKALCLGANLVSVGRPVMQYAVGGGYKAVTYYLEKIQEELKQNMVHLGISSLKEIPDFSSLCKKVL